jgi:serine/threonine protein kinase
VEYKVIGDKPVGKGANSKVYLGLDELNKKVILKRVKSKTEAENEADILKMIPCHKYIIYLLDFFDNCLVLEYHNGSILGHFKKGIPREVSFAIQVTINVLKGLKTIHENGILHCDISPHNVLIENNDPDSVKIIDFGSAVRKNQSGEFIGSHPGATKYYRPPELQKENGLFTARLNDSSDLYSAACICLYLLNGEAPFKKPLACRKVNDKNLQRVLKKAVHPSKIKRYQKAEEFIEALLPFSG